MPNYFLKWKKYKVYLNCERETIQLGYGVKVKSHFLTFFTFTYAINQSQIKPAQQ